MDDHTETQPLPPHDNGATLADRFAHVAGRVATLTGHFQAFLIALGVVLAWAITGPVFGFSDTWQLVINTGTTIVTFLMVFLIQNTQNRDARAMHLKLDEVIRAIDGADDALIRAEDETDAQLAELKRKYEALADEHAALEREHATLTGRAASVADR